MTFRAPVADILFSLAHVAEFDRVVESGAFEGLDRETLTSILEEAGRFASEAVAPLNRVGDRVGARFENGRVFMPDGFRDVYRRWAEAGWGGVTAEPKDGGMGLPHAVGAACFEILTGASMAFALCPLLTSSAVHALYQHGGEDLKALYLPRLVSGEWTGTMNLTEPQAGSDLSTVKTRAERAGEGLYLVRGQKIFITYGEHDLAENIVHLVLARLPDAPEGTRGLSLFLVPKFLVDHDGRLTRRNDVRCAGVEHKLGIRASPTCVMIYGENDGARGWLVGEEHRGLHAMFVMMNSARLGVGLEGVGVAERAYQQALAYARERRQGRSEKGGKGMSPIVEHADVHRMLLTMKGLTQAARSICHLTAVAIDLSKHARTEAERRRMGERAALLTPIAKAFSTDIGEEVASLGVQIHGGMGYIEQTGAAQHLRDSRIAEIYEGANGIQAIDLVQRKLPLSGGETAASVIAEMREIARGVSESGARQFGETAIRLGDAIDALERATRYLREALALNPYAALAGATPYLKLFGLTLGGACLAKAALAALQRNRDDAPGRLGLARFFAEKLLPVAGGLATGIASGSAALEGYQDALAEAS